VITNLHIEPSSYCNASCPGCPRNGYGYPLKGFFKETNLHLDDFKELLKQFKGVRFITYCGNHGDPMMHPDIATIVQLADCYQNISTNGSIGRLETYKALAELNCEIIFGIDGLEDTNHLYRQGVIWSNLMQRVKTFIDAGGKATWQFIPFAHNVHQVDQARALSKQMGFTDFLYKDTGRNFMPAIGKDKKITHWILSADGSQQPYDFNVEEYLAMRQRGDTTNLLYKAETIDCEYEKGWMYVNAEGELFPCCYHGFGHPDRPKYTIKDFHKLKKTWSSNSCNQICAESCGKNVTSRIGI